MSDDDDPRVTYSGTFNAGTQQFAARDMYIDAPTEGRVGTINQQLADVEQIRQLVAALRLTDQERHDAGEAMDTLQEELAKPAPNQPRAAAALDHLTTILKSAGGLAVAGLELITPIGRIAETLGGLASGVLKMIGR